MVATVAEDNLVVTILKSDDQPQAGVHFPHVGRGVPFGDGSSNDAPQFVNTEARLKWPVGLLNESSNRSLDSLLVG